MISLQKIIADTCQILSQGKTILYPTDTVWGIGCDATNEIAVKKIFSIKQRNENKSLIVLVANEHMLKNYVNISPKILDFLKIQNRPTSVIYSSVKGLASNAISSDNTVAIRIVQDEFCSDLIHTFGKPIISTSANISGKSTPCSFSDIDSQIKNAVDFIIPLRQNEISKQPPSQLITFTDYGEIIYLRK